MKPLQISIFVSSCVMSLVCMGAPFSGLQVEELAFSAVCGLLTPIPKPEL